MKRPERRQMIRQFIKANHWRKLAKWMKWPVKHTSFKQKARLIESATVATMDAKAKSKEA